MYIIEYIEKKSPIHAWDPRIKFASLLVCIFAAAFSASIQNLCLILVLSISVMVFSKINPAYYLKKLKHPLYILFFILPLLTISSGGTVLISYGKAAVYKEGFYWSLIIFLRAVSVIGFFSSLFFTTKYNHIIRALESFLIPKTIIRIFLSTYRFIHMFFDYLTHTVNAARLRGGNIKNTLWNFNAAIGILTTLFIRGIEQSETCSASMRLRGFDSARGANFSETGNGSCNTASKDTTPVLTEFKISVSDYVKMLITLILLILIFITEKL